MIVLKYTTRTTSYNGYWTIPPSVYLSRRATCPHIYKVDYDKRYDVDDDRKHLYRFLNERICFEYD